MASDAKLREELIEKLNQIEGSPGRDNVGERVFYNETGYNSWTLKKAGFESFGELRIAAGKKPNQFAKRADPNELCLELASWLMLEKPKKFTRPKLETACVDGRLQRVNATYLNGLGSGKFLSLKATLLKWCHAHSEFNEILPLLEGPISENQSRVAYPAIADSISTCSESYIPPVVECLHKLAEGDSALVEALNAKGRNEAKEFERRVAIAFRMLGLDVEELGQGRGNNPDGIVLGESPLFGGWALMYDAKVRTSEYRLNTDEERKFTDYLNPNHLCSSRTANFKKRYFAVIGSRFRESDLEKARGIKTSIRCDGFVFLKCSTILSFIEQKIKDPRAFEVERFRKALETVSIV